MSIVANVRSQPSVPLVDGIVDDAVLQLRPDGDRRCTEYHIYSALLAY